MRTVRGVTLVELLITMVMLVLVGAAVSQVMVRTFRVSGAQVAQAEMQSNVRTGGLVLPLEFREIGYDSNITTNAIASDIEAISATEIQFRAMRGQSFTCGTPSLATIQIRKPITGLRRPQLTDGFLLYVENDENTSIDDQWIPLTVTAIDNTLCGADSAITLTTNTPQVAPGVSLTLANIALGGPVRYYERMRFGQFVDADGQTYLGARSVSAGEAAYRAVVGPLNAASGLQLRYLDRNQALLDPTTANPANVRLIEVQVIGLTRQAVSLPGSADRAVRGMRTVTRVALRNTLKH